MIKIEVTGNSLGEVADKLLAIGASLLATDHQRIRARGAQAEARFTEAAKAEAAEAAPVDPTPAPKSVPVAAEQASSTTVDMPTSAPASALEELEVVDLPIAEPEVNLRDLVLSVVEKRGKPFMEEILSSFGAAKASLVSPELRPELIALCNEALDK